MKKIIISFVLVFIFKFALAQTQPFIAHFYMPKDSMFLLDSFYYNFTIENPNPNPIWLEFQKKIGPAVFYYEKNGKWEWLYKSGMESVWGENIYGNTDYYIPKKSKVNSGILSLPFYQDSIFLKNIQFNKSINIKVCYYPSVVEDSIKMLEDKFNGVSYQQCNIHSRYFKPYKGIDSGAFEWLRHQPIPLFMFLDFYDYEHAFNKLKLKNISLEASIEKMLLEFRTKFPTSTFNDNATSFELGYLRASRNRNDSYKTKLYDLLIKILDDDDNRKNFNKALYYLKLYFPNDPKLKDYFLKQQNNAKTHAKNE